MAEFNRDYIDLFLGVIRKYMQINGNISQKDLAELTEVGVSTMSRFINQKTTEVNPQLVAQIVAKLEIPLHEIIDFVDESYSDKFVRLVKFYKGDKRDDKKDDKHSSDSLTPPAIEKLADEIASKNKTPELSVKEKLENLSPRQKAFLTDFLNLDMEGKDLVVDIGNSLLRYFRQKGLE